MRVGKRVEVIDWKCITAEMPDEGITVLLFALGSSEAVWPGYLDDSTGPTPVWRSAEAGFLENVTHWAEMPQGPKVEHLLINGGGTELS
jgi:hypothetical protein